MEYYNYVFDMNKMDFDKEIDISPILDIEEITNDIAIDIEPIIASLFKVKKVILNNPATIIFWLDGTKTIVKCQPEDEYDAEKGIAMCYMKKLLGNTGSFNDTLNELIDPDYRKKRRKEKKERKKVEEETPFD